MGICNLKREKNMIEAKAYTQVSHIISLMSNSLKEKIPQDFIDMIELKVIISYGLKRRRQVRSLHRQPS